MPLQGVPSLFGGRRGAAAAGSSLLTGLQASWTLNDVLSDSSGNNNTLTAHGSGAPVYVAGKIADAVSFNGTDQWLSIASNAFVQTGDVDWTIALWAYFDSLGTTVMVSKYGAAGADQEYQIIYSNGDDRIEASVWLAGPTQVTVKADNFGGLSIHVWHCVIVWHDAAADTLNISIDDGATNSQATGGALQAAGSAAFNISGRDNGNFVWAGILDDVNKWNRVLSAGERTCFYNAGTGTEYPFTGLC